MAVAGCERCGKSGETTDAAADGASSVGSIPTALPEGGVTRLQPGGDGGLGLDRLIEAPKWASVPGATASTFPNMSFAERFRIEAQSRPPNIKPKTEDGIAAFEKAGLKVVDRQQHLANVYGARYCLGMRIADPADEKKTLVHASLCEFATEELAKIGQEYSTKQFSMVQNRKVLIKKQITATLREDNKNDACDAALKTASDAFDKL